MRRFVVLAYLFLTLSPDARSNPDVREVLNQYEAALAAAEQTKVDESNSLKAQYATALERLKAKLDPGTDVEALLAVAAEIEALSRGETVDAGTPDAALIAARETYDSAKSRIDSRADAKLVFATEQAISRLKKLTGSLAAGDDLDGALAAEEQRRKLETGEGYLAAKQRAAAVAFPEEPEPGAPRSDDLRNAIPRNGLVGYFPFDGRLDDTRGDTVLSLSGGRRFASGRSGRALNLEKPSEQSRPVLAFPLPSDGKGEFSVSYCICPDMGAHSEKVIFSVGKEGDRTPFWVSYQQRGGVGAEVGYNPPGDGYYNSHAKLPRPEPDWHHVAISVTEEEAAYYLDGQLMLTMKPSSGEKIDLAGMQAYIGTFRDWHGQGDERELSVYGGPDMLVDELAIYDRALNATDARSLAKNYGLFETGR